MMNRKKMTVKFSHNRMMSFIKDLLCLEKDGKWSYYSILSTFNIISHANKEELQLDIYYRLKNRLGR